MIPALYSWELHINDGTLDHIQVIAGIVKRMDKTAEVENIGAWNLW